VARGGSRRVMWFMIPTLSTLFRRGSWFQWWLVEN